MTAERRQKLAEQVQDIGRQLHGKTYTILVWDGDDWCASVSFGITKGRLEQASKFWAKTAESYVRGVSSTEEEK